MPALSAHAGQVMLLYAEGVQGTLVGPDIRLDMKVVEIDPTTGRPFEDRPPVQVSEYDLQSKTPTATARRTMSSPGLTRVPGLPPAEPAHVPRGHGPVHRRLRVARPRRSRSCEPPNGAWKWASAAGDVVNPSFHAIWTDNRNVRFPDDDLEGDWTAYSPPGRGQVSCENAGSRDQDVFTSEISSGLVAGSPSLFKSLLRPNGQPIQRAFVVYVQNRTEASQFVTFDLVPSDANTVASFDQFDPSQAVLPPDDDPLYSSLEILPHSTLTRTVYVHSTTWNASVDVEVWDAAHEAVQARVVLNEASSPFVLTNTQISDSETHTPRISNPRISNPRISNPRISNPRISNWTVSDPRISNPRISNPRISNETLEDGWQTRDVTYTMLNTGNTTTVYDLQTYIPDEFLEEGSPYEFQLIVYRTVSNPGAGEVGNTCAPVEVVYDEFISRAETPRISNPRISNPDLKDPRISNPRISNPRISNTSFYLEPAEGPLAAVTGGDATQSFAGTAAASMDKTDTRTSSVEGFAGVAATLGDESQTTGLPVPKVNWTLRIYQTRPLVGDEPPIWELAPAPTDPPGEPRVSAAVVSQSTNVIDGVPDEDPPFVLVGPEPPVPAKEVDGELVPMETVPTSPSGLSFSQQPTNTQVDAVMTPPVEVRLVDSSGATVPVSGTAVTLSLLGGSGPLGGTTTRLSDSGFAVFDDLTINATAAGSMLQATSPGLASATSLPFDVTVDSPLVPPITTRVSVDSAGGEGFGPGEGCSGGRSITPDGRFVAFACTFTNLVSEDTNGVRDVFVRDLQNGTTTRVSVTTAGTEANGPSSFGSLSADGRFVAFQSSATNLDTTTPDTNGVADIFLHDRDTDGNGVYDEVDGIATTRVSVGQSAQANGGSSLPAISANGESVAFWSSASNLVAGDTNGQPDVFVYDRASLAMSRVSVKTGGAQANSAEGLALPAAPALSGNGRIVAFQSTRADLADKGKVGWRDIYVHDRDTVTTTRVSVASDGTAGTIPSGCGPWDGPDGKLACADFASSNPSLSADGRFVAFDSIYDNLVPNDANFNGTYLGRDVFVHDRQAGVTTLVSVSSDGVQDNTFSGTGVPCGVGPHAPALSPDGRFVTFSSCGSTLVEGDTNGLSDAFLRDRLLGTTVRTSVASGGTQVTTASGAFGTHFTAASTGAQVLAMGSDVETMVPGDTNRNVAASQLGTDVFVSRPIPAAAPSTEHFLVFTSIPTEIHALETIAPAIRVEIRDASGNTDLTATDLVTLSVASGAGSLQGTTTVSAVAGVAVFSNLALTEQGTHTLRANAVGFAGVASSSFVVLPPSASRLGFVVQPSDVSTQAGDFIDPAVQVAIQDDFGDTVLTGSYTVTLALSGSAPGLLYGTTSVTTVNGIATFENLSVDVVGTGYALVASSEPTLTSATSDPFDVLASEGLVIPVENADDSGKGSLRQALLATNANVMEPTYDFIPLNIPGAGPTHDHPRVPPAADLGSSGHRRSIR